MAAAAKSTTPVTNRASNIRSKVIRQVYRIRGAGAGPIQYASVLRATLRKRKHHRCLRRGLMLGINNRAVMRLELPHGGGWTGKAERVWSAALRPVL
jgi:hypothetical protein